MSNSQPPIDHNATSGGHMSEAHYLDQHFEAMRPEYEQMAKMAGFEAGWRILDAGCGGGSYLSLLSELVGESGYIMATDLATENVQRVLQRIGQGDFVCEVEARTTNVTKLPFADNAFDAVWCAAVTQYLSDDEVMRAFNEFKRVVKPGGLIAIKEADFTSFHFGPFPSDVLWRLFIKGMQDIPRGVLRASEFSKMLRDIGLTNVTSQTILAERYQPLSEVERRHIREVLSFTSALSQQFDLPKEDQQHWSALGDIDRPEHILNDGSFFFREPHNLTVARIPSN